MVSCKLYGGLGNCCFQIATTIAYARKWDMSYFIPKSVENPHRDDPHQYFFPGVVYSNNRVELPVYLEPGFEYKEIPYMKDVCLQGYFQSYLYFNNYRDEIIKAFDFDTINPNYKWCALHYRAGDYKLFPTIHPIVSVEYIANAIVLMMRSGYEKFMVFSDEVEEIKAILSKGVIPAEFKFIERGLAIDDMKLMASCGSHIMSNSTYSWWGHFLCNNPEKKAVAPSKWFGEGMQHDTKDLMMPHFILI